MSSPEYNVFLQFAEPDGLTKDIVKKELDFNAGLDYQERNPDKLLMDKGKDIQLYDTMMFDDVISGTINIKKRIALSVGGSIKPASEEPQDQEIAEFVSNQFDEMETRYWDVFDNMLDGMIYGYKVGEKIWKIHDSAVWLENVRFRHPILFDFKYGEYGELTDLLIGKYKGGSLDPVKLPNLWDKFLIFVWPYCKDGVYYGRSDLMEIYQHWYAKQYIFKWRNIFIQNFGQPITEVQFNSNEVSSTEKSAMETMLDNLQDNQYFFNPAIRNPQTGELMPKFKVQFHLLAKEMGTGTGLHQSTIDQLDKQMRRKLLTPDKIGFSESPGGSYNQAETQLDVFEMVITDMHGRIEDAVNSQMIRQIVDYNFESPEKYPEWKFDAISSKLKSEMLRVLVDTGIVDKREKWLRPELKIPILSTKEQEEINEAKKNDPPPVAPGFPSMQFPKKEDEAEKKEFKRQTIRDVFNFDAMKKDLEKAEADFIRDYTRIYTDITADYINRIQRKQIIENKDYAGLKAIDLKIGKLKDIFTQYYAKLYLMGKVDAIWNSRARLKKAGKELGQYVSMDAGIKGDEIDWLDREWIDGYLKEYGDLGILTKTDKQYLRNLKDKAFFITGEEKSRIEKVFNVIDQGIKSQLSARDIISKMESYLSENRQKYALTIARTNEAEAYNTGMMNQYMGDSMRPLIEAFQYSAIVDENTTDFCREHDGQIIRKDDPEFSRIQPPNHYNALLEGTEVTTKSGTKAIEDILPSDYVLTHKGQYKKVITVMGRKYSGSIRRIEFDSGKIIFVTKEHPCLTSSGWKIAGDLNIGDKLFQHIENTSKFSEDKIGNPNNFESLFDEDGIPYQIMGGSLAGSMVFTIDFDNQLFLIKNEIGDIVSNWNLKGISPDESTRIKESLENYFMSSGICSHESSMGDSHPFENFRIIGRVVGSHSFGVGGISGIILLTETESPVIASTLMKRWVNISNSDLIDSVSDLDSVSFTPTGKNGFPATKTPFNRTNGKIFPKMIGIDKSLNSRTVTEINHDYPPLKWITPTIITIVDEEVKEKTIWNLAVEDDQSYHGNGIIVHNCRSVLIPIFIGEDGIDESYFSGWKDSKNDNWNYNVKPAKGFGG